MEAKKEHYLSLIREHIPDLQIGSVHVRSEGQFSDVLILNENLIFRFPRYTPEVRNLAQEVKILRLVKHFVSLPVPEPFAFFINEEEEMSSFMAYRMLSGQLFWQDTLKAVQEEALVRRLAGQVAAFMAELHAIPLPGWLIETPNQDGLESWQEMYAGFKQLLFPHMRPDARREVSREFEEFFAEQELQRFSACLRHGDFGPGNILYDPQNERISGVIDFSSAGLGDPAVDIASASCLGDRFFKYFGEFYPGIKAHLKRAQFYKSTYALQEALHGAKNNDAEAFKSGLEQYV